MPFPVADSYTGEAGFCYAGRPDPHKRLAGVATSIVTATGSVEAGPGGLTGLEYSGNESTNLRRMLYWASPFGMYDATYIFKVFPREKTTGANPRYYTTFFWGNNGAFNWGSGYSKSFYGAHPYPVPAAFGPGQWEISVDASDIVTGVEVEWDRWFTQAIRVWRVSGTETHHQFIWDYDLWIASGKTQGALSYTMGGTTSTPPTPCICVGQAPDASGVGANSGVSWGGYAGYEEFKGIIRGMQFYDALLNDTQLANELSTPGSARTPWYSNINPTPTDVTDKSGSGNNPLWDGASRPTLWSS